MSLKEILLSSKKSSDEGISLTEEDTDGEDADTLYKESKHESEEYYKINAGEYNNVSEETISPTTPHALRPPSHLLKARKLTKHNSLPVDKHALQRTHQRQESTNSAVSPRFMAMRKLSEVTALPSNTMSSSVENLNEKELQSRLASHIDEIINTQLQLHLGQLVWRASESHLEARRFWEDQKKEMFGFAAELLDRIDHQADRPKPKCTTEEEKQKWIDMENELLKYKLKSSKKQRELFEMDVLKTRNLELEKEHEEALIQLNQSEKQRVEKTKLENRIKDLEEQLANYTLISEYHSDQTKVDDLITLNKQLKNQLGSVEQINRQLHEQMVEYESKLKDQKIKMKDLSQRNRILEKELIQNKPQSEPPKPVQVVPEVQQGLDCGEDFGTKRKEVVIASATVNWADMMNSEEEEVKNWSKKYKVLEKEYNNLCQKLKDVEVKDEKKQVDLVQTLNSKENEIKRLKQAGRVNAIQLSYLQQELNKLQSKKRVTTTIGAAAAPAPAPPPHHVVTNKPTEEEFATKDGYLTFTTEINGRPSTYSIKIPNNQKEKNRLNPNAPVWNQ